MQRSEKEAAIMRRVVLVGVGVLVTLAGVIFTLQGVGVLGGSVMSGVTFWAVAGPVIALAGLALAAIGLRGGLASQARRLCRGRQLPPRPDLPGHSPGDGVPVGASGRAAGRRVSGRTSTAWHAGGSFVMSARSPGVRLRTLPTGT